MRVKTIEDVPANPVDMEGAEKVKMRLLLSEEDDAPNFRMRLFEVEKGGCSPYHTHNYEHEVLVLEGSGELIAKDKKYLLHSGSVAIILPNEEHQFKNTGDKAFKFICLIPIKKV
jgi:quercetin dioxygenase-like cupin family protein